METGEAPSHVPWLGKLLLVSPSRFVLSPSPVCVGFVVHRVPLGQFVPPECFAFPLSVSFPQYSTFIRVSPT